MDIAYLLDDIFSDAAASGALIVYIVFMLLLTVGLGIVGPILLDRKAKEKGPDQKSVGAAYMLFFAWGGVTGVHRFYAGKIGTAILWFFTWGLFGIGAIVDLFLIPSMIQEHNQKASNNQMIQQNNQMIQNMQMQNLQMQNNQIQMQNNQMQNNNYTPVYNQQPSPTPNYNQASNMSSPKLYAISGEYSGAVLDIPASGILLGRDPSAVQLVINDIDVSRKHCVVSFTNGQYFVTDYSANGTFLNSGERLQKGIPRQLYTGDVFYLVTRNHSFKVGI